MAVTKPNWTTKSVGSKQTAEEMNSLVLAIINNADELTRLLDLPIVKSNKIIIDDGISFTDSDGNIVVRINNSGLSASKNNIEKISIEKIGTKQYNI